VNGNPPIRPRSIFQLADPYALPAFRPADPVNAQFNRPALRNTSLGPPPPPRGTAGPDHFATPEESPTGGVLQKPRTRNAAIARMTAAENRAAVVLTTAATWRAIFFPPLQFPVSTPRTRRRPLARSIPSPAPCSFPWPKRVNDPDRKHCVKAQTNNLGESGVIFLPFARGRRPVPVPRFFGPPTVNGDGSDGKGASALFVDTGTLVIWRSMRISRFVRQPANAVDPTLLADGQANGRCPKLWQSGFPAVTSANTYLQRVYAADAAGNVVGAQGLRDPDFTFVVPAAGGF